MAADEKREPYLLEELGGLVALKSFIQEFARRVIRDPLLKPFLMQADPRVLSAHQERFFAMALTEVNVENARAVIRKSHMALFADGLDEEHFDAFSQHLLDTLQDRGFGFKILDKVMQTISPLRQIFQDAGEDFIFQNDQSCEEEESPVRSGTAPTA